MTIFHWCQIVSWNPMNEKIMFLKNKLIWAMWKWMVTMATLLCNSYMWGCTSKFNHILADTDQRLLILVPNGRLDIPLLSHDLRCNYLICIFMNINENLKNKGKIIKKHHKWLISTPNHHQTTIVACFYIISDTIRQILSSYGLIWKLSHLHIHEN